jgi:hypothetical protein
MNLSEVTFDVLPREVGLNPKDPDHFYRSQRVVLNEIFGAPGARRAHGSLRYAFHGPTGSGKTFILKKTKDINAEVGKFSKLIFTFPTCALVRQQAPEIGAHVRDRDEFYALLVAKAKADPLGEAAQILNRDLPLPKDLQAGKVMADFVLSDDLPIATTIDSFHLLIKGVIAAKPGLALEVMLDLVRRNLKSCLRSPKRLEALAKHLTSLTSPRFHGTRTEAKVRASIRAAIKPKHPQVGLVPVLSNAIIQQTRPQDLTPGPKYHYSPEAGERLTRILSRTLVVVDEYHVSVQEAAFYRLVQRCATLGITVLFMSGTPRMDFLRNVSNVQITDFDDVEDLSMVPKDEKRMVFNHPMKVTVMAENFRSPGYDAVPRAQALVAKWDLKAPGPCLLVYEATARCRRVRRALQEMYGSRVQVWMGSEKSAELNDVLIHPAQHKLPKDAIVVGTSAVGTGVDLPFRNAYLEANDMQSLLQYIGRIGRRGTLFPGEFHYAVIAVAKTSLDILQTPTLPIMRPMLETTLRGIVPNLLPHRADDTIEGLFFRNDHQAQFTILFKDAQGTWKDIPGSKALLSSYRCKTLAPWWSLTKSHKQRAWLKEQGIPEALIKRVMFQQRFSRPVILGISLQEETRIGTLTERDTQGASSRYVNRTWYLASTPIGGTIYPVPKKKPIDVPDPESVPA